MLHRRPVGPSELDDSVSVPVGVLEPGRPFFAQRSDPLLVRLEPITVVLLEDDAVGGEFIDRLLQVDDLPGGDRSAQLAGVRGGRIYVDLAALATWVGDPAVEDLPTIGKAQLCLVELLSLDHVR